MQKAIVTFLLFFGGQMALANSLIVLSPSSVTVEENSGQSFTGRYTKGRKIDENNVMMNLVSTRVFEIYDEVVLAFENIPKGQYQFRFKKISKPKYGDLEYCSDGNGLEMDSYKRRITTVTAHMSVLSAKGSETAEIRLGRTLPPQSYVEYVGIRSLAAPDCLLHPPLTKLEWLTSKKLDTEWSTLITVKTAQNLVLRIPKEAYDVAESFELAVVAK